MNSTSLQKLRAPSLVLLRSKLSLQHSSNAWFQISIEKIFDTYVEFLGNKLRNDDDAVGGGMHAIKMALRSTTMTIESYTD